MTNQIKPFLKWAGGKGQLIPEIESRLPEGLTQIGTETGNIRRYVEPFVGSGAVLFHLLQNYNIDEAYIMDKNPELVLVYKVIKQEVEALIEKLKIMEEQYLPLNDEERKLYFYDVRKSFNDDLENFNFELIDKKSIERAAQFIFLNRTCFNGLFRVNKRGEFNVPMGAYKNPQICNPDNLRGVHRLLQRVEIHLGDYTQSNMWIDNETFVYFDPPYRPLSSSSSFNSYTKYDFTDTQQIELSQFFSEMNEREAKLMLSNSDPKNTDENDNFFDDLYRDFNINRVSARRNINSKSSGRGIINELLITNYDR